MADPNQPTLRRTTIERATITVPPSQVGDTIARLAAEGWTAIKADHRADEVIITAEREAPTMPAAKTKPAPPTTIAGRLKAARIAAGMTGRQVSDATGLATSFISDLENGRREPTPDTIYTYCVGVGVNPGDHHKRLRDLSPDQIAAEQAEMREAVERKAREKGKGK